MDAADYPIRWPSRVRYAECDPQGVAFNAHYLSWFDCTLNEAFRDSGIDWVAQMRESGCDVQLVKSLVEYRRPLRFDEAFVGAAGVARLGRSSIQWRLALWGASPADLRATGEIVWVYADLAAGRAQALPDWLREQLRPLAGAGAGET